MEIERVFLLSDNVAKALSSMANKSYEIEQYYTHIGAEEERYRKKGNNFFHTLKKDTSDSMIREEIETKCTEEEYELNKGRIVGSVISKTRYVVPFEEKNLEVDIYKSYLSGLAVVEIEFKDEKEANDYSIPSCFGDEITDDLRYRNQQLAQNTNPQELIQT